MTATSLSSVRGLATFSSTTMIPMLEITLLLNGVRDETSSSAYSSFSLGWHYHVLSIKEYTQTSTNDPPSKAFLSWLRLATYMAVVAVAIMISFHLKHEPSSLERRVALPFGLIFWLLAIACLVSGLNNYIKTVNRYSRRQALVQSGVATQIVSLRMCVGGNLGMGANLW